VVSGREEAQLSFAGSTGELLGQGLDPFLVLDIGGGSTEFVLGSAQPEAAWSVDMGCVRLTERHLRTDPPTPNQIVAARSDVEELIDEAASRVALERSQTLVGLAGSVTTVAAIALGLPRYDSAVIHHSRIGRADVHTVTDSLLGMTRAQRAALPVMHPGRVDVIGGGALVLDAVLDRLAAVAGVSEVLVSEHDILDGIAWSVVGAS
jgi:exopolyphosphatase/guanosine-5'-triphosphate,3'-diphosphate pyrophosphatase